MMTRSSEFKCNNYLIKIELPNVIFKVNNEPDSIIKLKREDIEELKKYCQKWLCDHPLPRYYVEEDNTNMGGFLVKDRNFNNVVADFKAIAFDNKKFAEDYAKALEEDYRNK